MSRFPVTTLESERERLERERRERERDELLLLALLAFRWDRDELAYFTHSGKRVPQSTVRRAVDAVVEATRADVAELSRQAVAREIDVAEWQDGISRRLKTMHTATAAAAAGGFENMSPAAVARLEGTLRFHLVKLEGFAEDLARGYTTVRSVQVNSETGELQEVVRLVPMTERRVIARAEMYALAGASESYEGGRRQAAIASGFAYEKNVLHPADHCRTEVGKPGVGCLDETLRGWQRIGTLTIPGERRCLTRCKCTMSFARELPEVQGD